MAISFNSIPSNLLVPFVAVEFDASAAQQGPALLAYRALLVGQKTGQGTAAANSLHKVTSANQVLTLAGRGSQLHRMAVAWFQNNKSTEAWIGVLEDNTASVYASGTITASGTASAAGTISLYVGGQLVQIAVASGDTANTIAAAIAAAVGIHASGTVTMSTAAVGDDVTIGGTTFVATSGAVTPGAATYSIDTGDNAAAASLAAQVNAHATAKAVVRASASSAVVTLRAVAGGTAGNAIVLTTTDAVHAAVSGTGTLAGGGTDTDLPVHASVSSAVVTLHARNGGACGNDTDVRVNYQDGEALPAGVSLAIVAMASGATNPVLTTLIATLGDSWFHVWAHPYTDATSLTAIETELASRTGPMRMIDGLAITSAVGSYSTLGTLGDTRNSPHNCILAQAGASPLTPPCEFAAGAAGVVAFYGAQDPARPFQTLQVVGALAPAEGDLFTLQERNLLIGDGVATAKVAAGGIVQLERMVTTYKTNAAGADDSAYRDANTLLTLMYARYSFRNRWATKYPRHKLANDGTRVAAGQKVMTPMLGRAEAICWFQEMEELGLFEGFAQFKRDIVVERNALDPNRLDFLLPPDLINQLVVTAAQIGFRL